MKLYRAVSYAELIDIETIGELRPGPPSFQGKWFAERVEDAAEWGRRLFRLGNPMFHLIEVEIADEDVSKVFRSEFWDRIGPAQHVYVELLGLIRFVYEVPHVPTRWPVGEARAR